MPWKPRDHRDLAARHRGAERAGVDIDDARAGMRFLGADRQLPAEPAARRGAHRLQRQCEQARGHLFACGDDDVIFCGVVARVRLAAEIDEAVGFAGHGGNDDRDLVAVGDFACDELRHGANSFGARHRRAPEFHHDPRHLAPLSRNWFPPQHSYNLRRSAVREGGGGRQDRQRTRRIEFLAPVMPRCHINGHEHRHDQPERSRAFRGARRRLVGPAWVVGDAA